MSQDWKTHQERSTPLALYSIRWIALHMGRPLARLLLYPITLYYLAFAPAQRRASRLYLNRALSHPPTLFDIARHIHCFAATILDRVFLLTGQFNQLKIDFPDENMPLKFSRQGKGCILLGSHIGSFEVLRSYAVKKCPLPIKILMHEGHNPMMMQVLNALNEDVSKMVISLGAPDSLIQVKDAIDAGCAVGILGDRVMEPGSSKTVRCTLLGGEIELPVAPIMLAASLKAPIIVFFGIYLGGNRYKIHFELLSEEINPDRNRRQETIQHWMQKYANIMEKQIRQSPYNWFNFFDYWQDK